MVYIFYPIYTKYSNLFHLHQYSGEILGLAMTSQITGHELFHPVPMEAQELSLDSQESQLYTP